MRLLPRFDRDGNLSYPELWVNSPADIEVIGSLKTDARFDIPITLSERYGRTQTTGTTVRWQASCIAMNRATGSPFGMPWDKSWFSKQGQMLRFGDRVEAIGHPDLKGVEPYVLNGLYRLVATNNPTAFAWMTTTNTLPCA